MDVIEELRSRYEEAKALWASYETHLQQFRSKVKNDVSSLEASARGSAAAALRIKQAHAETLTVLTSAEMDKAISNAERLATALEKIQGLQAHTLTLAVIDSKKPSRSTDEKVTKTD